MNLASCLFSCLTYTRRKSYCTCTFSLFILFQPIFSLCTSRPSFRWSYTTVNTIVTKVYKRSNCLGEWLCVSPGIPTSLEISYFQWQWYFLDMPFSQQTFWLDFYSRKSTGVTNNINNSSVLLKCPSKLWRYDSEQHAQYQDPETKTAKWNSTIIHFVIYTCSFLLTCQNVLYEKGSCGVLANSVKSSSKNLHIIFAFDLHFDLQIVCAHFSHI